MSTTNTILHRRFFEDLIRSGESRGEGDEVAYAILYAALAAARGRLGSGAAEIAITDFLAEAT